MINFGTDLKTLCDVFNGRIDKSYSLKTTFKWCQGLLRALPRGVGVLQKVYGISFEKLGNIASKSYLAYKNFKLCAKIWQTISNIWIYPISSLCDVKNMVNCIFNSDLDEQAAGSVVRSSCSMILQYKLTPKNFADVYDFLDSRVKIVKKMSKYS